MSTGVILVLVVGIAIATRRAHGRNRKAMALFTLSEQKKHPDRFSDHLPWAMLVAPGIVFNKNGSFQTTLSLSGTGLG